MMESRLATAEEMAQARILAQKADCYSILGYKLRFGSDMPQARDMFRNLYRHFRFFQPESVDCNVCFLTRDSCRPLLLVNEQVYPLHRRYLLPSRILMLVINLLTDRLTEYLIFHGAAVCRNDEGIIICGTSGSGKTTLALKLAGEGYEFLSDEFSPIHRRSLELYPFPRSVGVRQGTLELLPHLKSHPLQDNFEDDPKWFLDAACLSPRLKPCTLKAVYFIRPAQVRPKEDRLIDIAIYEDVREFAATLCKQPGVKLAERQEVNGYPVYRFQIKRVARCLINFLRTCQAFKELIFYCEEVQEETPDFSQDRTLLPMDKPAAILELLKHLRSRSCGGMLCWEFPSLSQLMLEVGRIVDGAECWQIS